MDRSERHRLMASPLCPAPMTTVVVCMETSGSRKSGESQSTSTLTLVGFVMMS